jgi:hypothetical protein
VTREVDEHIKVCAELMNDRLFFVDVSRCPMFVEEIEVWHYAKKRGGAKDAPVKPVDDFNHCMSNFRYAAANIRFLSTSNEKKRTSVPIAKTRGGVMASRGGNDVLPEGERWRGALGAPAGITPDIR